MFEYITLALFGASIPLGLGIAADVFAVTLVTALLFPEAFKKYWFVWLLAVGGGHAILPMVGQLSVIYLGPFLREVVGLDDTIIEFFKIGATVIGCGFLYVFLKEVWEGVTDSKVVLFVGLTIANWWSCTADALYSGAVKAAQALEYGWNLVEIALSNIFAALIVMLVCIIAIVLGLRFGPSMRKPIYQIGAYYVEFVVLGYLLVFFAITRGVASYAFFTGNALELAVSTEIMSAAIAMAFITFLFVKNWGAMHKAQTERIAGMNIVEEDDD